MLPRHLRGLAHACSLDADKLLRAELDNAHEHWRELLGRVGLELAELAIKLDIELAAGGLAVHAHTRLLLRRGLTPAPPRRHRLRSV